MTGWIIVIGFVVVGAVIFARSLHFLNMNEIGIKKWLGKPGKKVGPGGFCFVLCLPKSGIEKRPTTLFDLAYKEIKVLTKAGEYLGRIYGSVIVTFKVVGYLTFPVDKCDLILAIQAGISQTKIGLIDITQESVKTAVTDTASRKTWPEIFTHLVGLAGEAETYLQAKSPLLKAGFKEKDIELGIEQATLPKSLEDELTKSEVAQISVEVGQFRAQLAAFDLIGPVLYSMAEGKGITLEQLQAEITGNAALQEELHQYAKKVNRELQKAKLGAFFQFKVNGAEGIEKGIMDIFALVKALSGAGQKRTAGKAGGSGDAGGGGGSSRAANLRKRAKRVF